jgi:hypothetical protein
MREKLSFSAVAHSYTTYHVRGVHPKQTSIVITRESFKQELMKGKLVSMEVNGIDIPTAVSVFYG